MDNTVPTFNFDGLKAGQLGISAVYGSFLAEAASHCLHFNEHPNPLPISVSGHVCVSGSLEWCHVTKSSERTWADLPEATEYGAYGVAIVVALPLTKKGRVERSAKGTGIDYWLGDGGDRDGIFQRTARLEVSGILKGDKPKIAARLDEKLAQTKQSEAMGLPAYVAIVDFGGPEVKLVKAPVEAK